MGFSDEEANHKQPTTSSLQYGGNMFADVDNLDHCVKYLNQTLTTFGFPSTLNLHSNDPASMVQTCNCIYALLQQRQRDIQFRDDTIDQRQRLISDMTRLEAKVERQDLQLVAKERELAALSSKEQKAAAAFKAQVEKMHHEKDELQRLVVSTQQVRVQQTHELKKKEKEYVRLQDKLNQVLTEKKKETKPGLEIMNLLQKEGRQRGTWNTKKADGDFYKMIVDAYEAKKQELMAENTDLRALLRSMQSDMRDFLNMPNGISKTLSVNGSFEEERPATPLEGRTDVFDLPFHMARDQIEQSLRAKMASIKERMLQLQEAQKASRITTKASDRESELEAQLVEARSIITEQASLMSKHLVEDPRSPTRTQVTGEMETTVSAADKDRVTIGEWTNQLEMQRSTMRQTVSELDREPVEVDMTKQRLENCLSPENVEYSNPEIANIALERSKSLTQIHLPDPRDDAYVVDMDVAISQAQDSWPELEQAPADNENRLTDNKKNLSKQHVTSQETKMPLQTVNPIPNSHGEICDDDHVWPDVQRSDLEVANVESDTVKGGLSQSVWTEFATVSIQGKPVFHVTTHGESGNENVAEVLPHSEETYQAETPGHRAQPESQLRQSVEQKRSSAGSKRMWSVDCETESQHFQDSLEWEKSKSHRALSHELRKRVSQRTQFDKQTEEPGTKAVYGNERRICPDPSSSRSSRRESSGHDLRRVKPEFWFIADDAWVDHERKVPVPATQQKRQMPPITRLWSQSDMYLQVEPQRKEDVGYRRSASLNALSMSRSAHQKSKQVSCFCCRFPSGFSLKKKRFISKRISYT